jgi:hypothetical protein
MPSFAGGRKTRYLIPEHPEKISVKVSGKEKSYYMIHSNAKVRLQVDGPGKLTVMSRLLFQSNESGNQNYTIRLFNGRMEVKTQTTQTQPSEATVLMPGVVPGKARKCVYKVEEGSFVFDVMLEHTKKDAVLRFLFQPAKQQGKLVSVQPLSYDKVVTVQVKEKLIAYYVASKERDVQLRVVGPTKIRVSTRLNYDEKMKGKQKYSITVSEGAKVVSRKALQTTKSLAVNYKEWKDVVPGKAVTFTLDVPDGEHTYHCTFDQTLAKSVSIKFSIPSKDLLNEQ